MTLTEAAYKLELLLATFLPEDAYADDHAVWASLAEMKSKCEQVDALPSGPCEVDTSKIAARLGYMVNDLVGVMLDGSRRKFSEAHGLVAEAHRLMIQVGKMFPRPPRPPR